MSKLLAHRDAPIPSLCRVDPDIPASVDLVFRKMVAKQAKDRYQSMTEVIRDLEACQSGSSPEISEAAPSSYEDPGLQSFLSNLGAASLSNVPTQQVKTPAAGLKVNAASDATMINGDVGVNTDPETMTSVRAEERQKRRSRQQEATQAIAPPLHRNPRVLPGGAAAAIVLLIAVIILIPTPHGTLRLEILDPEVEVTIKGTELTLSGTVIEPISLKTGEKNLVITRGDLSFETEGFTLRKGTETRVKVELLGHKLVVNGDGKVIAEQPIHRKGITASTTGKDSVASKSPTSTGDAPSPAIAPFDAAQAKAHQEAWARYLGVPVEYTNSIGMEFRKS
jgi:serine/threonine-protein kinase